MSLPDAEPPLDTAATVRAPRVVSDGTGPTGTVMSPSTPAVDPFLNWMMGESSDGGPAPEAVEIPGYEVLGELGRGGMGVVYKARQAILNRIVALKMAPQSAGRQDLARFLTEAEAVAAVDHPHVVRVFEFGDAAGRPFLAMEFLDGGSLADHLRCAGRLDPRVAAGLVGKVSRGVQAAHDAGVVHRDLKPGNVLLDAAGEPKVADFGLAKRGDADLTRTQAVMGTPAYMAPEQARGDTKFAGPAADVWALGIILYECLTGTVPFRGDDPWSIVRQVIEADPTPPRSRTDGVPRDLELICLRCLAKSPRERYPTAAALADDLDRFLSGGTVSVRPARLPEQVVKWTRRNPVAARTIGVVVVAVVVILGLALKGRWDARAADERVRTAGLETALADERARAARAESERAEGERGQRSGSQTSASSLPT